MAEKCVCDEIKTLTEDVELVRDYLDNVFDSIDERRFVTNQLLVGEICGSH